MQPLPPAGWYPDPNGSPQQRWWNGQGWTQDLSPVPAPAAVVAAGAPVDASAAAAGGFDHQPYAPQPYAPQPYPTATSARPTTSNRYAFITMGVVALYIFIAMTSHVVMLGIFPLLMSMRSKQAREPLAPLAIVAAIVAIVVSVTALSGH